MRCAYGSWGGQRPSLGGYVTVTGPRTGRPPPKGVHVDYAPCAGVFVMARSHAPEGFPRFARYGNSVGDGDGYHEGRRRQLFFVDQIELISPDLLRSQHRPQAGVGEEQS